MSDKTAVLFANEAFYVAFLSGDYVAMESLWARHVSVSCIHPGWHHLMGRDVVMESWQSLLHNAELPDMSYSNAVASVYGDTAVVICYETFPEALLVATNVFVREKADWKIVHHQSGGSSEMPDIELDDESPGTLQ
ncbi:MAG: nuclear transport factor 2 family protein [Rhodospirillales bacterium]|nr:nuclear transport factor 2 family protein [Rhodospirillales bacterium]